MLTSYGGCVVKRHIILLTRIVNYACLRKTIENDYRSICLAMESDTKMLNSAQELLLLYSN